jgi:TonB family protein
MSKYRRKRVLFICIGNACRSPMAEAIARVDASDKIDAFSAGLAPIGHLTETTEETLKRNGCWVEDLESKGISPKVWEQVDIVINMSGRPREQVFYEYSKVEDWHIEDPYAEDPEIYQRVFEEIRLRVAKLAKECRQDDGEVRSTERRARKRWYPASPILINLNGGNDAVVSDISEDGLALAWATTLPNSPLYNMQVQFLGSPHPLEVCCQIAWKRETQKKVGIQFVGLTEEARQHIRNWISEQASPSDLQRVIDEIYAKQSQRLETPNALQRGIMIPVASISGEVAGKHEKTSLLSPAATSTLSSADPPVAVPRTYARVGLRPNKKAPRPRWRLASDQGSPGALRRRRETFLILALLAGFAVLTLIKGAAVQHNAGGETIADLTQKTPVLREAVKPVTAPPVTTSPSVPNPPAIKAQAHVPVVEPPSAERVKSILDTSPKHSPRATIPAKKPLPTIAVKTPSHGLESMATRGQSTKELPRVVANLKISPVKKTQQQGSSSLPPTPPQLESKIEQPATLAPLPSRDVQPAEPESKASAVPVAKQPATPANITGAVAVLADPYPSLRIPNVSSKKQRQGTSLQLGHLLSRVEPIYPEDAKQQGIQGTVKLHAIIDRHGSVENLQSVNGPPILVAAAMNAVRQWRFSETLLAGHSVETEEDIDIVFRLSNPGAPRK